MTDNRIKKVISSMSEKKYWDDNASFALPNVSQPYLLWSLTDIPQGTGDVSRIGDQAIMSSIQLNIRLQYGGGTLEPISSTLGAATVSVDARVVVFQWYDDTLPVAGDILQTITTTLAATQCPFDHDKKTKRKILCDKIVTLRRDVFGFGTTNAPASQPSETSTQYIKQFIDMKSKPVKKRTLYYQGGTTTGVNKIFCLVYSDIDVPVAGPQLFILSNSRCNFTDG